MTAKYELTDVRYSGNPNLRRIRALRDIPRFVVEAGDLGGWIESPKNLSQSGDAWVFGHARGFGHARVSGDARVFDSARVFGGARVSGDARVSGNARVSGDAQVYDSGHTLLAGPMSSDGHHATLVRTTNGHQIAIGCWTGTVANLRDLATSDRWPSGCDADTRDKYRPRLFAFADLCDAQMALWGDE